MSRTALASMLVAALLGSSAFAATGSAAKKGKDEKFAPRRPVAAQPVDDGSASIDGFAPAVTLPSGPAIDAGGIDPKGADATADPVDQPGSGSGGTICFTAEMLKLYLAWLGVDLDVALRHGLLEDARLVGMFFDYLAKLHARSPSAVPAPIDKGVKVTVDFAPAK